MRPLAPVLCALLAFGCAKSPDPYGKAATSQFAEISLALANPSDPATAYLSCTAGLIPAYKYKDAADLQVWVFPYASGPRLTKDCELSDPALQGKRVRVFSQSFSGEGALLSFQAQWPGGPRGQILALDIVRNGRRLDRIFGIAQ